jgi:hypothetical protein
MLLCCGQDKLEPYIETSKRLYKELVTAQKDPGSGVALPVSVVYRVSAVQGEAGERGAAGPGWAAQRHSDGRVDTRRIDARRRGSLPAGPLPLWPHRSRQNFLYAAVDPIRRIVKLLYYAYVPVW